MQREETPIKEGKKIIFVIDENEQPSDILESEEVRGNVLCCSRGSNGVNKLAQGLRKLEENGNGISSIISLVGTESAYKDAMSTVDSKFRPVRKTAASLAEEFGHNAFDTVITEETEEAEETITDAELKKVLCPPNAKAIIIIRSPSRSNPVSCSGGGHFLVKQASC